MTDRTVTLQPQQQDWLLDQIEHRLEAIGKVYYQNGKGEPYDREIAELRRLAVQLGFDFEVEGRRDCFEIRKIEVKDNDPK